MNEQSALSLPDPLPSAQQHSDAAALIAQADASAAAGQHHDALLAYQRAVELEPASADLLHRVGLAAFRADRIDLARGYLDRALHLAPHRAQWWEHRGLIAALSGDHVAAEAFYQRALSLSGGTASQHRNLADSLRLSAHVDEARTHYRLALDFDPSLRHALRALARISTEQGAQRDAADYWLRAWAVDRTDRADLPELFSALAKAQRDAELQSVLAQLRTDFAADAPALLQLAFALNGVARFHDAASVAAQGLAIDPHDPLLHHNASFAFNMLGDSSAMRQHAGAAARLLPEHALMQFNFAAAQLRDGDYADGWRRYAWHEALPENADLVRPDFPEWRGEALAGRRFLLIGEQGLGDQIQFLCMADWLHRQGATVDVWVEDPLREIAADAAGVHTAWSSAPPGPYDYWCRMLRMPMHMQLSVPMLPLARSYLVADAANVARWESRLHEIAAGASPSPSAPGLRVGIVWAGNPAYELDRYRSIPLQQWRPLLEQPGVTWFSLQKGAAQDQADAWSGRPGLHRLGAEIDGFADTLAIVQSLDLVITVDSAVAHLAGACGTPVWLLVPTFTDWRWMTGRDDSPWYPSLRLFRQRELGCWQPVLDDVTRALRDRLDFKVCPSTSPSSPRAR